MTVLVGVHCQDGVIIGTDSAVTTAANVYQRTLQETGCLKIDVHFGEIITAVTGDIGLAQRFKYELETLLQGKQIEKFKSMSPVPYVTAIAHNTIENFKKTTSAQQHNLQFGWGLGGLVAFVAQDKPQLAEFSATQFHPELKGLTTSDGKPTNRPYVTMGGAQAMADPFIAHASRMLFGTNVPNLKEARLLVAWTLRHVIEYNTGGVAGDIQVAVLERQANKKWSAHMIDAGEMEQQVAEIENYIGRYWDNVAKSADATAAELTEVTAPSNSEPGAKDSR